ncbi:MAG: T9SS type A sorting domain-containing protein [Candidatus Eisenbacteria sp.]|nr:T9SS type A sorting domain-containing protein [Candidatus Eisenbacteria bacterium]
MKSVAITVITAIVVLAGVPASATTWNVPGDAATIAGGLALASAGDTVLVACDTYYESGLDVRSGVVLRSATGDPSCVTIDGAAGRGPVIYLSWSNNATSVEGFTITGGSASYGGGMSCFNSYASVRDCNFNGNSATVRGGGVSIDAGMRYYNSMDFVDCSFNGNTASDGGALYHGGACCNYYNGVDFVDCTFDQNTATNNGGAVVGDHCTHDFTNCTFSGNTAETGHGGGVLAQNTYYGAWDFTDCTFSGNSAGNFGGGVCFDYPQYYSTYDFTGCTFSGNSAAKGGGFGMMDDTDYHDFDFTGCTFSGNTAISSGGGVYTYYSGFDFLDCTFDANSAPDGGGAFADGGAVTYFTSTDFIGNTASSGGGAAYSSGAYTHFYNSTLYGNSASMGAGLYSDYSYDYLDHSIIAFSPSGEAVACSDPGYSSPSAWCTDIYGNAGGDWVGCIASQYPGQGNMSEDPMFCCGERGNLRIDYFSPCQACDESPYALIGNHGTGCRGNRCERWGARDDLASVLEEQLGGGTEFRILSPAPNPFNPSTEIAYSIPAGSEPSRVTMKVYDATGRAVTTLIDEDRAGGMYSITWNGRDHNGAEVASGVYFYRTTWNGKSQTQRMVLLK